GADGKNRYCPGTLAKGATYPEPDTLSRALARRRRAGTTTVSTLPLSPSPLRAGRSHAIFRMLASLHWQGVISEAIRPHLCKKRITLSSPLGPILWEATWL